MWTFRLLGKDAEVVGFTSMSPSNKANDYQWAEAIMGEIDAKLGWGAEDVIGGRCILALGGAEDAQGVEKNVVKVKPTNKGEVRPESGGNPEGGGPKYEDFGQIPS